MVNCSDDLGCRGVFNLHPGVFPWFEDCRKASRAVATMDADLRFPVDDYLTVRV